jgi:hypothetical protein
MKSFLPLLLLIAIGCDSAGTDEPFDITYAPSLEKGSLIADLTNPYLPLPGGHVREYAGTTPEGHYFAEFIVSRDPEIVAGAETRRVRIRRSLDGMLAEIRYDWYAQDTAGNVWWLARESSRIDDGRTVDTVRWEADINGALAGIVLPSSPAVGQAFRMRYVSSQTEDRGRVAADDVEVTVEGGSYVGCVRTEESPADNPLNLYRRTYCPDVGLVLLEGDDGTHIEFQRVVRAEG